MLKQTRFGARRRLGVALIVAACLSIAASVSVVAAQSAGPRLRPFQSALFDLAINVTNDQTTVSLPGAGAMVHHAGTRGADLWLQLDLPDEPIELVVVDRQVYLKSGDDPWTIVDASGGDRPGAGPSANSPIDWRGLHSLRQLGVEIVDGTLTTRWSVDIDGRRLADFIKRRPGLLGADFGDNELHHEAIASMLRDGKVVGDIWVENETGYLRQAGLTLTLPVPVITGLTATAASNTELRQEFLVTFSGFNQPVVIVAPIEGAAPPSGREPIIQMPKPASGPLPVTLPRTGDWPTEPIIGVGLGLALLGIGLRCLRR